MSIRTQIYLPEDLYRKLKLRTRATGQSMAEQIRESLERYLDQQEASHGDPCDPIWEVAGKARSKAGNLAEQHDLYLYGPIKERKENRKRKGKKE